MLWISQMSARPDGRLSTLPVRARGRSVCANLCPIRGNARLPGLVPPCMVIFYIRTRMHMPAEKMVSVSFRVTPTFKELLEVAAAGEQRSRTNLLEKLLFDHCRQLRVLATNQVTKKKTKRETR